MALLLALSVGGCAPAGLPQLPAGSGQIETAAAGAAQPIPIPVETATVVSGEPTELYTRVARGIHACWFGAGGPLSATHIFHAEAQSPSQGGQAEIVIHERDVAQRDQRGPHAFRVSFESAVGGARVGIAAIKLAPGYGEAMTHDVGVWAKGGSGCRLRESFPQPAATAAPKLPGKPGAKSTPKSGPKGTR